MTDPQDDMMIIIQAALLFVGLFVFITWAGGLCFVSHKNQGVRMLARINSLLFLLSCFCCCCLFGFWIVYFAMFWA